jgi:hypothetical protein
MSIDSLEGFGSGSAQSLQEGEEVKMGHFEDMSRANSFSDKALSHSSYMTPNGYFVSDTCIPV